MRHGMTGTDARDDDAQAEYENQQALDYGEEMSEPEEAPAVLTQDELDALRPRAATDADIARHIATVDAYAAQLAPIYTPEPGLKQAPPPFEPFEQVNDTTWSSKSGWKVCHQASRRSSSPDLMFVIWQVTDDGEGWRGESPTLEAAMHYAEVLHLHDP